VSARSVQPNKHNHAIYCEPWVSKLAALLPRALVKGLDPGRVNLYTTAEKNAADGTHKRQFYSRNRHLEKSGQNRMRIWRDQRASQPEVAQALKDLSLSAGAHGYDVAKWVVYLTARIRYRDLL